MARLSARQRQGPPSLNLQIRSLSSGPKMPPVKDARADGGCLGKPGPMAELARPGARGPLKCRGTPGTGTDPMHDSLPTKPQSIHN
jgi:hypothetical protein